MEIISDYIGLISTEFNVIQLEGQIIIKLFSESLIPLPKFNDTMQNDRWPTSVKTSIAYFETTANNLQYTLVLNQTRLGYLVFEIFIAFFTQLACTNVCGHSYKN